MTVYDVDAGRHGRRQRCHGVSPDATEQLLRLGGHIAHVTSNDRCGECRRILPGGFSAS